MLADLRLLAKPPLYLAWGVPLPTPGLTDTLTFGLVLGLSWGYLSVIWYNVRMVTRIDPHHFIANGYDVLFDSKHLSWAVVDPKKNTYVGHSFSEAYEAINFAKAL